MRTLVLGPPIIVENWRREISKFSKFGDKTTALVGPVKKRLALFKKKIAADPGHVFITNYQALLNADFLKELLAWAPEVFICDESHRLKEPSSKTTKAAIKLSQHATRKLILTGTPVLNSPMDIFTQMLILDGGVALGKKFFVFRQTYFIDMNAGMPKQRYFPKWVPNPHKVKELEARIAPITSVVKKEECLSLPPLVRQVRYVDLGPEQARVYRELQKDFVSFVGDKSCTADLAITKALRMQQVVSGYVPIEGEDESELHEFKDNPRIKALEEIIDDIGPEHKIVIWAVYHANYKAIRSLCERRKIRFVEVNGSVAAQDKQKAVDEFAIDREIQVLIGHPGSAGIGISMVAASYSVFYSRNFSLEHSLQAESRTHRGGSEIHSRITRIDIVAKDTIDEHVVESLLNKGNVLDSIMKGIKDVNLAI